MLSVLFLYSWMGALPGTVAALAAASAMTRSPALSQSTTDSGLVHSGAEYSGCAWSTYSRAAVGEDDVGQAQSPRRSSWRGVRRLAGQVEAAGVPQRVLLLEVPAGAPRPRRRVAAWYALTIWDEVTIALAPGCPGTEMPYSVSVPITRRTLISPA